MVKSEENSKIQAGPFCSTLRSIASCCTITSETVFQAGLHSKGYTGPVRLFFGDQTDAESMELLLGLKSTENPVSVEVSGYFKHQRGARGVYLDDSALFVETLTLLS